MPAAAESTSTTSRRIAIIDAAISVLAAEGGRGLTHRAIDRQLGLALGSTANYFKTRTSLLRAVNQRLLELDVATLEPIPSRPVSKAHAATLLADNIIRWLEPEIRRRQIAHYELLLQSARDEQLRGDITAARRRFTDVAARILAATGCQHPDSHALGLVALYDGLFLDQSLYSGEAQPRHLADHIGRLLADC